MKAKPVKLIDQQWCETTIENCTHVKLIFPINIPIKIDIVPPLEFFALRDRYIPVQLNGARAETSNWSWNGDTGKPTLRPSILTTYKHGDTTHRCHSFVNDGKIQFLSDCSHELVGQTVELLEVVE